MKDSLGSQKSGQTSISHGNSGLLVIERGESVIDHPISLWDAETVFDRKDVQIMTSQSSHNRVVKSRAASAPASAVAPSDQMKIAVVGASGRIGRLVVDHLLSSGHSVVPVSRTAPPSARATHTPVNVLDSDAVHHALQGVDGAVVTLGISENPAAVRLRGAQKTANDVRSRGTRHVIEALRSTGARRLVVLSSTGVGESAAVLTPTMRVVVAALLRPQFNDHERQEGEVRESGLDWTIARPVNLRDGVRPPVVTDIYGRVVSMSVGFDQVAESLARWAVSKEHIGDTVALSS